MHRDRGGYRCLAGGEIKNVETPERGSLLPLSRSQLAGGVYATVHREQAPEDESGSKLPHSKMGRHHATS